MKVATFENMRISVPLKDDETIEIIANRLLDAIDSIGDNKKVLMDCCHRNLPLDVQQIVKSAIDFYWIRVSVL